MMTTLTRAPISKSELFRLSQLAEYIGSKLELWDGDVVVLKPTPAEHTLKVRLLRLLREQYKAQPIGYILQDAAIELPGADCILKPALAVINAHQPGFNWDCAVTVMPQCIIEIASRDGCDQYLHDKMIYYGRHGCELPILIDPVDHSVEVLLPTGFHHLLPRDLLDGGAALPGFRIPVWRLFVS
jgi:Uma2 family endonuclease